MVIDICRQQQREKYWRSLGWPMSLQH